MNALKIIPFLLLTLQFSIVKAETPYTEYRNQKHSFSVPYPADFLFPQGESDSGDGQVFLSKDAQIELRCWATYSLDESLKVKYEDSLFEEKSRSSKTVITYKPKKNNWFIISGIDNAKKIIFYRKVFIVNSIFKQCLITYPENSKNKMNKIVTKIFNGFVPQ